MAAETLSSSIFARLELWHNSFVAWLDHPVIGHGLGAFEQAYAPHRAAHGWFRDGSILTTVWNAAGSAHNVILQALVEVGLVGAIIAGTFLWLILRRETSAALIAGAAMCLIGFPEQSPASAVMIACALGLACRLDAA